MKIDKDITLLNATQLAVAMGVHYRFILKMKRSGFPMPDGRSTISEVLEWRKSNPKYHKHEKNEIQLSSN